MDICFNRSKIFGAIIAGGKAGRLGGIIKGNLKINNDNTIIDHLIRQYRHAGIKEIAIIANDSRPYQAYNLEVIPDLRIGIGPLAGIESGLNYYKGRCDAVLFLPSDIPNITANEISVLKEAFITTEQPVVYPATSNLESHPLCVVVNCDLKETITSAIDHGQRKVRDIWEQVNARIVQFPDEKVFFNINTPFDIKQLRATYYEKKDLC